MGALGWPGYQAIRAAIDLAKAGEIAAMVTAPIHKEALSAAGGCPIRAIPKCSAEHGGAERVAMMLANDELPGCARYDPYFVG